MSKFNYTTQTIAALKPKAPHHVDVVVSVTEATMATMARSFAERFDGSRDDDLSEDDKHLLAGAFVTTAGHLPIGTYDLIDWIATCGMFDPKWIAIYAEEKLGMERLDTPVSASRRRKAA